MYDWISVEIRKKSLHLSLSGSIQTKFSDIRQKEELEIEFQFSFRGKNSIAIYTWFYDLRNAGSLLLFSVQFKYTLLPEVFPCMSLLGVNCSWKLFSHVLGTDPKSMLKPNYQCGGIWRYLNYEGETHLSGIGILIRGQRSSLPLFSHVKTQ